MFRLDSSFWWVHFSPHVPLESFLGHPVCCEDPLGLARLLESQGGGWPPPQKFPNWEPAGPVSGSALSGTEWEEEFWTLSRWEVSGFRPLQRYMCDCPPGTSSRAVLPATRRRVHLPGFPLSGEAAAPGVQELCADRPAGKGTSSGRPARTACWSSRGKGPAEHRAGRLFLP